mmetsp:Transcript_128401/g.363356  ORF Transcript_128401/g.363356 Transcript_128401/m.363356 type:complete len:545 (-) Transcript_128401:384-2018(-)
MEDALHDQHLGLGLREHLDLGRAVGPLCAVLWLGSKHLGVHLVRHLQVLYHGLMDHHIGVEDGLDAVFPHFFVILLRELPEDIRRGVRCDGVELRAVHVLERRPVVVLDRHLVANLREEAVVHARMPDVVGNRGNKDGELFQIAEVCLRPDEPHEAGSAVKHVQCMGEVVEGHVQILLLDSLDETLESLYLVLLVDVALAWLVEVVDCEDCEGAPLRFCQRQRVETPRLVHLRIDAEVLQPDGGGHDLLPGHCEGPAVLDLPLHHDVLALHHAQDAEVLLPHVIVDLGAGVLHLQLGDDGKFMNHLLQELHLVGAVDVAGVVVVLLVIDLGAELEDRRGDDPDGLQHALQRAHRELVDDARECEAAEDHDDDDKDDDRHGQARLKLGGVVHVESDHEGVRVDHQRGRHPVGGVEFRHPPVERRLPRGALEVVHARRLARARLVGAVFVAVVEIAHEPELLHGVGGPALPHVLREPVHPCLQRVVVLGERPNVEEGNHHHKDDREASDPRGEEVRQLGGDRRREPGLCPFVLAAPRQERDEPEHP